MRLSRFLLLQLQYTLSSSLALGLVVGLLVLVIGKAEGSITLDIDISSFDSLWFLLGIPLVVTVVFFLCSPLAFIIQRGLSRIFPDNSNKDS